MNKNCFACMIPSNRKFDKHLWNKSFSQCRIEKSDFTILVPGKNIATTPQYSIRFRNRTPSKDQPSLKLKLLERKSMSSFNTDSHMWFSVESQQLMTRGHVVCISTIRFYYRVKWVINPIMTEKNRSLMTLLIMSCITRSSWCVPHQIRIRK